MKISRSLSLALLLSSQFGMLAEATASSDLNVAGVIRPAACVPSFSANGTADYGVIPAATLERDIDTVLPAHRFELRIRCEAPTGVALRFADNRGDSVIAGITGQLTDIDDDNYNYGLGMVRGQKVGGFALSFEQRPLADGVQVYPIVSADAGQSWRQGVHHIGNAGQYYAFGSQAAGVLEFSRLQASIDVKAIITPAADLPLVAEIPLSGLVSMEMIYL